ncbi:MAG: hypothetical protein AB7O52_01960 [Planctomycetota bacterium]
MLGATRMLGLAFFVLATVPGCVYLKDRGNDLLDVAGVDLAVGPQSLANVRFTKAFQIGAGNSTGDVLSWHGRRFAYYEENREEMGFGMGLGNGYYTHSDRFVKAANGSYRYLAENDAYADSTWDSEKTYDRGTFEVGFRVPLLFLGLGAHIDPMQIGDLLAGLICIDFARDDTHHREAGRNPVYHDVLPDWPEFPAAEVQ